MTTYSNVNTNKLVAAIDLGSNSFHILVAEFVGEKVQPLQCWGEKIQLAAGLDETGMLSVVAKQRAFVCLARFAEAIAGIPVSQVRVVGTDALRRATDSGEFVIKAESCLGLPIDIISGEQEGCLIYQGVVTGKKARGDTIAEKILVVDIGGGSTEIVLGQEGGVTCCASLSMGCVSYSQRYFPDQRCDYQVFQESVKALKVDLEPFRRQYKKAHWQQAIGTAGTARAIESVLMAMGWADKGISRIGLEKFVAVLCEGKSVSSLQLLGLARPRFDIMTAGVAIMLAIFQVFQIEQMDVSTDALCEGLVYSMRA